MVRDGPVTGCAPTFVTIKKMRVGFAFFLNAECGFLQSARKQYSHLCVCPASTLLLVFMNSEQTCELHALLGTDISQWRTNADTAQRFKYWMYLAMEAPSVGSVEYNKASKAATLQTAWAGAKNS